MILPDATDCDALVALARHGTFSGAAKKRGVAVTTIARRIAALEAATGLALIDRRASGAVLTDAGRALADVAGPLSSQLDRIGHLAASLRAGTATRPVRVSATEFVVSDVLAPHLAGLATGSSRTAIELRSEADVVSLAARDADIAVRMVRPEGASLIVRKLPALTLSLYAAHVYSERQGIGEDLSRAHLLTYDDSYGKLPETVWIDAHGLGAAVVLRTASTRALLTAARGGAGVALLPDAIATQVPELIRIYSPIRFAARTPWLTYHRDMQRDRPLRRVADWIEHCFRQLVAQSVSASARTP